MTKTWKRDIIDCGLALVFAIGAWWWISQEYQKKGKAIQAHKIEKISIRKPCSIVCGYWNKDGILEIVRED